MASLPVNKIENNPPAKSPAKSNVEWQAWGEKDPLFGVIPLTGRERDGATPWTDADFYETGRADWTEFRERWERYGLKKDACLEIGCGAGRITCSLAQDFAQVYGVDVAEGMIAYARQHMPPNVSLSVTDGVTLPVADQAVSAIFSVIVFLHFDKAEYAASYFREAARVLKPGGSIMIQLPLHSWPSNTKSFLRRGFGATMEAYMAMRRWKGAYHRFLLSRKKWSPFMQSISYDTAWVRSTLEGLGFSRIEFSVFQMARGGVPYSWVFAQKVQ
jgi:ubiquinone/menaquinone biosynthesis C-methylase UbiE